MRTIILAATFVCSATFVFAQQPSKVNQNLKAVTEINNDPSLTTKMLTSEQFLDKKPGESGQLTGYLKNGKVVKIQVRMGLPTCVRLDKYYLLNDTLIMFYRQERAFLYNEATKAYDVTRQTTAMEGWYYYDGATLLKSDFKGEPKCSEKPSEQDAAQIIANAKKYAALLTK